ncbi:DUF883 family protein [Devosia aurantiaca]|uniref:DUF883 family protein n=1 Tax=Devosia aurantiaca TaxID=2714858 RepID=A0A6M1SMG4_9HYPH|nr:DUF883 family protein [Devosia aurantiaca]NGP18320.1 DUF883 family protein [Devosia aurantiaca]
MATTNETANANRKPAGARVAADIENAVDSAVESTREEQLEAQVAQLQNDLKSITHTLAKLTENRVEGAKEYASAEFRQLKRRGQHVLEDAQGQAEEYEQQLKDTIREKPLTAVATAVGIGFVLALLTRH